MFARLSISEALPVNVVKRAGINREKALGAQLSKFSELLADTASIYDAQQLLAKIETDIELIHSTYVRDQWCVDRVADWIAEHGDHYVIENSDLDAAETIDN